MNCNYDKKLVANESENEFVVVTKHYGYCLETDFGEELFVIYNIKNGKAYQPVAGMKDRRTAKRECLYLEKLNEKRWRK